MENDFLIDELAQFTNDPLGFVFFAFPWGEEGELKKEIGPDAWQCELLARLGKGLITIEQAIQIATTSGHGVGKSALVAWIILWAMSTFPDTRGVVTANTENQLKTKTWAELAKWYRLFIGKSLFDMSATKICSVDKEHADTWRIDMVPWSERNMEAFAGLHNKGRRILILFDEASAIPEAIWETTEGALTDEDTQIIWLVFGNPTLNNTRFRQCFPGGKFAHRWHHFEIDSRTTRHSNKAQLDRWIEDYGIDSDFVRIRVLGKFPRTSSAQFIGHELVSTAMGRVPEPKEWDPLVIGVDVARFGDDHSVIFFRRGNDAKSIPPIKLFQADTMQLAERVAREYHEREADALFVDGGGIGAGVIDRLRQLGLAVFDVQFGGGASNIPYHDSHEVYKNKRAEMYGHARKWLRHGALVSDEELLEDLTTIEYTYTPKDEILLSPKKEQKDNIGRSPDLADAFVLTFAFPVQAVGRYSRFENRPVMCEFEYDPMENIT